MFERSLKVFKTQIKVLERRRWLLAVGTKNFHWTGTCFSGKILESLRAYESNFLHIWLEIEGAVRLFPQSNLPNSLLNRAKNSLKILRSIWVGWSFCLFFKQAPSLIGASNFFTSLLIRFVSLFV